MSERTLPEASKPPNSPVESTKLPAGDRKFVILSTVRKLEQAGELVWSKPVAEAIGISEQLASQCLHYYWGGIWKDKKRAFGTPPKYGYLDRKGVLIRNKVTGKLHRAFIYWMNQKGNTWLDRRTPLVQKGFAPRTDIYTAPGFEPEPQENQPPESE